MVRTTTLFFGAIVVLAVLFIPVAHAQSAGVAPPAIEITSPGGGAILPGGEFVISGTAPPNYNVHIYDYDSGAFLSSTVSDARGAWSVGASLSHGMHILMAATAHDGDVLPVIQGACTAGPAQCAQALRVQPLGFDTVIVYAFGEEHTGPVSPELVSPINGATVNDNTFVLNGVSEPGASIAISDAFQRIIGSTTADAAGAWSMQITDHDGLHIYAIVANTDEHPGLHTLAFITVDSGAADPALPYITSPASGTLVTDGSGVVVTGTAAPGSVIALVDLLTWPLATAFADASGEWSATVNLNDGPVVLVATTVDPASGTVLAHSNYGIIHVDSGVLALERPVITSPDEFSLQRDGTITISGTAVPNSMISLTNFYAEIATTTSDGTGAWSVTMEMPDGMYSVSAEASTAGEAARSGYSAPVVMFVNTDDPRPKICR